MTDRAGLTDAECDALIRADLDKYYPNRDRNLDPLIRLEYRGWVRAAYAAGQAAATVAQDAAQDQPDDDLLRRLDQTVIAGTGWGMPRIDGISLDVVAGRAAARIRELQAERECLILDYQGAYTRAERAEAEVAEQTRTIERLKRTFNDEHVDWARRFKLNDVTAWEWMTRAESAEAEVARLTQERAARNAIDPVTRLHNLCDHLAEHRAESP